MEKELLIVFLYDTEKKLKEEDDPHDAVVYFHPKWVNANQRMALCGQVVGVTQFITSNFSFPNVISLNSGKFAMKKLGRYIMSIGTDRNISDTILQRRADMYFSVIRLFHNNLNDNVTSEKLSSIFLSHLPILTYAAGKFSNIPTLRLPKSASCLFLEAAQILEGLQDKEGVYGGTIMYQNKVVISQLSTQLTKYMVITDPFRIKVPSEDLETPFHLPIGVQLLIVYISQSEIDSLLRQKFPPKVTRKKIVSEKVKELQTPRNGMSTVLEEETEMEHITPAAPVLEMPDVVRDTMKCAPLLSTKTELPDVKLDGYILDGNPPNPKPRTTDDIPLVKNIPVRYHSLGIKEDMDGEMSTSVSSKSTPRKYYNTISDPVYPWFRYNGLPASKALRDDKIITFYGDMQDAYNKEQKSLKKKEVVVRPTSIPLGVNVASKKKEKVRKTINQQLKQDMKLQVKEELKKEQEIALTPLMAKLSILEKERLEDKVKVITPSVTNMKCTDEEDTNNRKKLNNDNEELKRCVLYVFGYKDVSLVLLLDEAESKNPDLIHFLWKTCFNHISELQRRFVQCFQPVPQPKLYDIPCDSYSFINLHTEWETLQKGGKWTGMDLAVLDKIHDDLINKESGITEVTVRCDDSVVYASKLADSEVYYKQDTASLVGLPVPSDAMGLVPMKAKRRLERDHAILLL